MPRNALPPEQDDERLDRLEDAGLALAALRKAIARGDRISVETSCWTLDRRLALAPLDGGDRDELRATLALIAARVEFGLHQRLRKLLLPLAEALQRQLEEAEKDL